MCIRDSTETDVINGGVSLGIVQLGASVVVNDVRNTTKAYVDHATVIARGTASAVTVKVWDANGTESTEQGSGLFVVADSNEKIGLVCGAIGVGGAGFRGQVSVSTIGDLTEAYISASTVNPSRPPASDAVGDVRVRAHQGTAVDVYTGVAGADVVGLGAAVAVTTILNTTRAYISGTGADPADAFVRGRDVEVSARTSEDVSTFIGCGQIGGGAYMGTVSVVTIDNLDDAYIQDADVFAERDLQVLASDDVQIITWAGTGALALYQGVGGTVAVNTILSETRARVLGSHLNAGGTTEVSAETRETVDIQTGTAIISANSSAGAVCVNTIRTVTEAAVGPSASRNSWINQGSTWTDGLAGFDPADQVVSVAARNISRIDSVAGAITVLSLIHI